MRISPLYEAVVLALGIAASANAAAALAGKTAPDSITEDLTISGAYDMGIYASSGFQVRTYQLILPKALIGEAEM